MDQADEVEISVIVFLLTIALRVAHFFALHALQVLPLAGLFLSRVRLSQATQVVALFLFAAAYTGGVWWLFASAMHGRPLL